MSGRRDGELVIAAKAVGDHSAKLRDLKVGTRVIAEGRTGGLVRRHPRGAAAVYLAAGIGITPIRALFEDDDGPATLIYRASRREDLLFRCEVDTLAGQRGQRVHYLTGRRDDPRNAVD